MRALQLDFGAVPPLSLVEVPPPALPDDAWVRLRPRLSGICGSDLALLGLKVSMFVAPYQDLPGTLGHEIVADIEDGGRVVVDTVLGCEARGVDPCPSCRRFQPQVCRRFGEGMGWLIGFAASVGGGWSEELVAPRRNVFPVPEDVSDESAVLLEPAACMLHAALLRPVRPPVLIVGAGPMGLLGIAVLRALHPGLEVVALAKHEHQARAAEGAGAVAVEVGGRGEHFEELAALAGARLSGPSREHPTVRGGFPTVFECVGSPEAIDLSFRMAEERGTVILAGVSGYAEGLDLAPTWAKELEVVGSFVYGYEVAEGRTVRTLEYLIQLLAEGRLRIGDWVTHVFPLEEYREALEVARSKASGALRVAFRP